MASQAPGDAATPAVDPPVLFRPGKKRKIYRQRATEPDETAAAPDANPVSATAPAPPPAPDASTLGVAAAADNNNNYNSDDEEAELSVAEVIRRRNARKHHKLGGVGFRATSFSQSSAAPATEENMEQYGLVLHDREAAAAAEAAAQQEAAILGGITSRFAPQTGLVGELVNKNMEEYIESELARRKRLAAAAAAAAAAEDGSNNNSSHPDDKSAVALRFDPTLGAPGVPVESQRVLQGRLMEIDLGEDARARTAAATERARRRLLGEDVKEEDESDEQHPKKVRLGPDGKPWRGRNRRNSDDIKRDQLVEEFLSENRLDVYDMTSDRPGSSMGQEDLEDLPADERIAEEFRRQFMDAVSQRQRRRRPAINASRPQPRQNTDEILRGPKLGGSRNARAAVRDALLREQEMKKAGGRR